MLKKFWEGIGRHRQPRIFDLHPAGAVLTSTRQPMPGSKPTDKTDIREPRYAVAALETVYKQTIGGSGKIPDERLWWFGKFPEKWATEAIRKRPSHWDFKRAEQVVIRVRNLYRWAAPILEG